MQNKSHQCRLHRTLTCYFNCCILHIRQWESTIWMKGR